MLATFCSWRMIFASPQIRSWRLTSCHTPSKGLNCRPTTSLPSSARETTKKDTVVARRCRRAMALVPLVDTRGNAPTHRRLAFRQVGGPCDRAWLAGRQKYDSSQRSQFRGARPSPGVRACHQLECDHSCAQSQRLQCWLHALSHCRAGQDTTCLSRDGLRVRPSAVDAHCEPWSSIVQALHGHLYRRMCTSRRAVTFCPCLVPATACAPVRFAHRSNGASSSCLSTRRRTGRLRSQRHWHRLLRTTPGCADSRVGTMDS